MNKRRKVLITITYNEMGIIIDTKAEEVAQPNLQSTCNQLATDCISRQAAIDVGLRLCGRDTKAELINLCEASIADSEGYAGGILDYMGELEDLPSTQPEYEELTPEEAASEIASGSVMSARYWLDAMIRLNQMGYAICRKR